jgi:hypothetical protein
MVYETGYSPMKKWIRLSLEFLVGVSLLSSGAYCQDRCVLSGNVIDRNSGQPIPGVNIIVRGEKIGTTTDTSGIFRLNIPTRQSRIVVFSHIAFQKETRLVSFDSSGEARLRISLISDTIRLSEVLITGKKRVVPSKEAEKRAAYRIGGDEFERLGEENMERALSYFLPFIIKRPEARAASSSSDFTLYVDGEWKESITLSDVDPFRIRRVMVWDFLGINKDIDLFPIGMPVHAGGYVVLIETK